jgi:hypothetical protein
VVGGIRREVEARRNENTAALERGEERLQSLARIRDELQALVAAVSQASAGIEQLAGRYGTASPAALLQETPGEEKTEQPDATV